MAQLSDLRSVKLRSTRIERDGSAPRLLGDLDDINDSYSTAVLHCNIENWLPILGPPGLTFESLLVPLAAGDVRNLMRAYEDAEGSTPGLDAIHSKEPLSQYEAALRASLLGPLQHALDQLGAIDGAACIVKTSSRSPKDAAVRTGLLERILRQILTSSPNKAALTRDDMLRAIYEAEVAALRFSHAENVLRALIFSERVWQDMTLASRHPDTSEQNIVVRRWEPVVIDMEFRCFLHVGCLTAISQYAYQLFSPSLLASTDAVKNTIAAYFDTDLRDALVSGGFETCIVDVALLSKGEEQWQPRVVEVNPFLPTTDAALFSWERERDILEGRRLPDGITAHPVMRVCEQARKGFATIPKAWKEVVLRVRQDLLTTMSSSNTIK